MWIKTINSRLFMWISAEKPLHDKVFSDIIFMFSLVESISCFLLIHKMWISCGLNYSHCENLFFILSVDIVEDFFYSYI